MRWTPLAVALLVQAALLLWRLDRLPVWGDEQFTLRVAGLPWAAIGETLRRDIHPPLYFALAKLVGQDIVGLRALSACTMLAATVAFDRLLLAGRGETLRRWALAAWALSPAVVLYGRMARSYALQTLLALVALWAAMRLIESPSWRRCAAAGAALAALLYTHYLPGLAVAAALAAAGLSYRQKLAAAALGLAGAAYLPWAPVLAEGVARAADKPVYALMGSWLGETLVRGGYSFAGLFLGEAYGPASFAAAIVVGAAVLWALARGWLRAPRLERTTLAVAALAGFAGASQWVSFPFMPARLLWLLPWLTALVVGGLLVARRGWARPGLAGWLALMAVGQALYARQEGFLNKGYLIPFERIADEVRDGLVLADATNCDPAPLRMRTAAGRYLAIAKKQDIDAALEAAQAFAGTVWHVRAARDVTEERIQDALDRRLEEAGFLREEMRLLPYSELDRLLLRLAGETHPPTHHVLLLAFRQLERRGKGIYGPRVRAASAQPELDAYREGIRTSRNGSLGETGRISGTPPLERAREEIGDAAGRAVVALPVGLAGQPHLLVERVLALPIARFRQIPGPARAPRSGGPPRHAKLRPAAWACSTASIRNRKKPS